MKCIKCGQTIGEESVFCPYCGEKVSHKIPENENPIYTTEVKGLLKSGTLAVYHDRIEFITSSVHKTVFNYSSLVSVKKGLDRIIFITEDGQSESCTVNMKNIHEAFLYIKKASAPYIARRKEALLAKGIYYSFPSSKGSANGILNIYKDKIEYTAKSGQREAVFFQDVQTATLLAETLELSLTNGTSSSYIIDNDVREEVLSFVKNAISPYVLERTVGFDTGFGIDERIEINEERGVFHIIRQNGNVITNECSIDAIIKCEQAECSTPDSMLGNVLSGGMSILNTAAKAVISQNTPKSEEKISYVGVLLTLRTDQGTWTETVRFGNFLLGMARSNKKYDKYFTEVTNFIKYLGTNCPECELVVPALSASGSRFENEHAAFASAENAMTDINTAADATGEKDQFGIIKYIEGVSDFICECATPMTIAIQGSWGIGESSIIKMLSNHLEERYRNNLIWFNARQLSKSDSDERLPILIGNRLIKQLATGNAAADSAIKVAKGIISITSGFLSQGASDGQELKEALFRDGAKDSPEKVSGYFAEQIAKRTTGENDKVIFFIDGLEELSSAKGVELLEAMKNFFNCRGCVFVITVDYNAVIRGANEIYGQDFDENKGKSFFNKIFQVSFRVPTSGFDIQNYVKDKLEHIGIRTNDETELTFYVELIRHSVGCEPQSMDRLFNSFLLLKKMADTNMYENKDMRLMLFALLCMQTKFRHIYDFIVRMKDKITPVFLSGLYKSQPELLQNVKWNEEEKAEFEDFIKVFCDIINTDQNDNISENECSVFAEVLEFSSITSQ